MANPSTQDLLIFVGIPLATIGIIFALVYASPSGRSAKRYRPGRPYPFAPVWYLARPEKDGPAGRSALASGHKAALGPGHGSGQAPSQAEMEGHADLTESGDIATASDASVASVASTGAAVAAREHPGVTGGASDRW